MSTPTADLASTASENRIVRFAADHPVAFYAAYFVTTTVLYALATRLPWRAPIEIPRTALDALVPFLPWSAAPYVTYHLLTPTFLVATRDSAFRGALRVAGAACVLGNLAINILVPTAAATWSDVPADHLLMQAIRGGDTALAAFPSGHVALPTCLAALAFRGGLRMRWLFVAWAVVLSATVLTTRQHTSPDVVGGLIWGLTAATLGARLLGIPKGADLR